MRTRLLGSITLTLFIMNGLVSHKAVHADLLSYRLENLKTGRLVELSQFKSKTVILSFFRARCTSCKTQIQELNCVTQKAQDVQIFAIGLGENSQLLKQTLMSTEVRFPALWASPEFLVETGPVELTPTTFILSPSGSLTHKLIGLKDCHKILKVMKP
jgi:peroxiredoxin